VALHDLQELDNDLGRGPDHDLALAGLLGVVDAVEGIVQDGGADHFGGCGVVEMEILKSSRGYEVSASVPKRVTLAFRGSVSVESALVDSLTRVLPAQLPMRRSVSRDSFKPVPRPPLD
jgi:hypothetical protein